MKDNDDEFNCNINDSEKEKIVLLPKIESRVNMLYITSNAFSANKKAFKISNSFNYHIICMCHLIYNVIINTKNNCDRLQLIVKKVD